MGARPRSQGFDGIAKGDIGAAKTPAQAELGRGTLDGLELVIAHLPALTKAPVVALMTPMPFLLVSLVP